MLRGARRGVAFAVISCCVAVGTASADTRFDWPLAPRPHVERAFDKPAENWLPGHRGVDLGGSAGQSVLAAVTASWCSREWSPESRRCRSIIPAATHDLRTRHRSRSHR